MPPTRNGFWISDDTHRIIESIPDEKDRRKVRTFFRLARILVESEMARDRSARGEPAGDVRFLELSHQLCRDIACLEDW